MQFVLGFLGCAKDENNKKTLPIFSGGLFEKL
jgi:hypothetical protein